MKDSCVDSLAAAAARPDSAKLPEGDRTMAEKTVNGFGTVLFERSPCGAHYLTNSHAFGKSDKCICGRPSIELIPASHGEECQAAFANAAKLWEQD